MSPIAIGEDEDDVGECEDVGAEEVLACSRGHLSRLYGEYRRRVQGFDYRGMLMHRQLTTPAFMERLHDLAIRSDDVLVASYPKSGTTWTEEIVSLVSHDGRARAVRKKPLHLRALHVECGPTTPSSLHDAMLRLAKSPRTLATHLPWHLLPAAVQRGDCKLVYVSRNPKDTCISYYYHHWMAKFLGNQKMNWDDFFALFINGKMVYGSWFDHVLEYWAHRHDKNVLIIKYEDMKSNLYAVVSEIAQFLDKRLSPEVISSIVEHCTFENMKNNAMCNREKIPKPFRVFDMSETKFMRKGIVGDWKNHFSAEQNSLFERVYERRLANSGLSFEFERCPGVKGAGDGAVSAGDQQGQQQQSSGGGCGTEELDSVRGSLLGRAPPITAEE